MGYLIILRGPAGSGKDTIDECLVEKLGGVNEACLLDLDITDPLEGQFIECLQKSLNYNHVIGMMFWGGMHFEEFNQIRNIFASKAGVREISIHTEGKSTDEVAKEILSTVTGPTT